MAQDLFALLRKLPLDGKTLRGLAPLAGRYGAVGLEALARGYLGDAAEPTAATTATAASAAVDDAKPADANAAGTTGATGATGAEAEAARLAAEKRRAARTSAPGVDGALLGRALHKLAYELGELALHNPTLDPAGKLPSYRRDEQGALPTVSVVHALAAKRWYDRRQAEQAAEAQRSTTPRTRLVTARSERYAAAPRYSYVVPTTYRGPR